MLDGWVRPKGEKKKLFCEKNRFREKVKKTVGKGKGRGINVCVRYNTFAKPTARNMH